MARSTTLTQGAVQGDLLKEFMSPGYNFVEGKLVNPVAVAKTGWNPIGQPVKASGANFVFVQDTDEANAIGIVLHDKPINLAASATSADRYLILRRGPALIDKEQIAGTDINGDALTKATIVTALAALSPPIIGLSEPATSKTQTT